MMPDLLRELVEVCALKVQTRKRGYNRSLRTVRVEVWMIFQQFASVIFGHADGRLGSRHNPR